MNVLITVPRLDLPGGVANFYRVLRNYLDSACHFYEVGATARESGSYRFIKRAMVDYWRFHRILSVGQYALVQLNPSLVPKSLFRDAGFLLIARFHSIPVLVFFHGWNSNIQILIARRLGPLFRFVFGKAAGFVVLAEAFRDELKAMGITAPIHRLTTCVDDSLFTRTARDSTNDFSNTHILFLSRLDYGKGLLESIRAFAELKTSFTSIRLTIAGDGPERGTAEALVQSRCIPDVTFLGHIEGDEKHRAFTEADIFLFPTMLDEGMPTTVLEAMAYGIPVVTRSVGGLKDFFENERMGFITESRDQHEFAALLRMLIENPDRRKQIRKFNRRYAREHFAASALAGQLQSIHERTAK